VVIGPTRRPGPSGVPARRRPRRARGALAPSCAVQVASDHDAAGQDPGVVSHEPSVEADPHAVQVSTHIHHRPVAAGSTSRAAARGLRRAAGSSTLISRIARRSPSPTSTDARSGSPDPAPRTARTTSGAPRARQSAACRLQRTIDRPPCDPHLHGPARAPSFCARESSDGRCCAHSLDNQLTSCSATESM
jgi:hypothetical protein